MVHINVRDFLAKYLLQAGALGWAQIYPDAGQYTPDGGCGNPAGHITPDELEYILARSLGYDVPVIFTARVSEIENWPNQAANLALMDRYETVRLNNTLDGGAPAGVTNNQDPNDNDVVLCDDSTDPNALPWNYMLFDVDGDDRLVKVTRTYVGDDTKLRGFISDSVIPDPDEDDHRWATLWQPCGDSKRIKLQVLHDDIEVVDYNGDAVTVTNDLVSPGWSYFDVQTRVYIRLIDVSQPEEQKFDNAVVTDL